MSWLKGLAAARPFEAFQIEVTSRCNLKCMMCPLTALAGTWAPRDMAWETFERIAQAFERARWVHLQGWGEPLLHPRFFDMAERAKGAGCRVGFTTNGTRLSPGNRERLLSLGIDVMAVSIAGARAATHEAIRVGSDFAKLLENVRAFLALRAERRMASPKVELFYLMTTTNLGELPDAVRLAADLGADELVATNLDYVITPGLDALRAYSASPPAASARAVLDEAASVARNRKIVFRPYRLEYREMAVCDLNPLKIVFIASDGSVSPCVYTSLTGPESIPRMFDGRPLEIPVIRFGNINEQSFARIRDGAACREFRNRFARRVAGAGVALLGTAARGWADADDPPPDACRSCPKLYGV